MSSNSYISTRTPSGGGQCNYELSVCRYASSGVIIVIKTHLFLEVTSGLGFKSKIGLATSSSGIC